MTGRLRPALASAVLMGIAAANASGARDFPSAREGHAVRLRNVDVVGVLDRLSKEVAGAPAPTSPQPTGAKAKALSPSRLGALISACAPNSPSSVVHSLVLTESGGYPLRMAVNDSPRRVYSPADRDAAAATLTALIQQGASVDIGLMQLNSATLARLHVTPTEALDPCRNIALGAQLFDRAYATAFARRAPTPLLRAASSIYNTGDPLRGLRTGYADRVQAGIRTVSQAAS